ncbi:MAG: cysteine dioxygenase [Saprospiraceae bacterium]
MKVINNLSELITELNNSLKDDYAAIGASLEIPIEQLKPYSHWNSEFYARNCIKRTEHYELILLCWEAEQETPVHCHGGEECWVYVMDGNLIETHFQFEDDELITESIEELCEGEISFMCDDLGYHKLENASGQRSMSLHLYMDPIDACTKFDENSNSFEQVDLSYYSYRGQLTKELAE